MTVFTWNLRKGLLGGDWSWSSDKQVALVLDGVAIKQLPQRVYEWSNDQPNADWLYVGTPWEPVKDRSPWLVHLQGPHDPILLRWLEQDAHTECGYLLVADKDRDDIGDWMRRLLQVERVSGVPEILRIGHPQIALSALGGQLLDSLYDHPFRAIVAPDVLEGVWHCIQKVDIGTPRRQQDQSFAITVGDKLLARFAAFERRRLVMGILAELGEPLTVWLGDGELPEKYQRLSQALNEADRYRVDTPRARLLFLELLRLSGTRPWCGEQLPSQAAQVLDRQGPASARLGNALKCVAPETPSNRLLKDEQR